MARKRSSSRRRVFIALDVAFVIGILYWFLFSKGAPMWVRLVVAVAVIAVGGVTTVNFFRTLLKASEKEAAKNPKEAAKNPKEAAKNPKPW